MEFDPFKVIDVIETHFGRAGPYVARFFVWVLVLGTIAFFFQLLWDTAIGPATELARTGIPAFASLGWEDVRALVISIGSTASIVGAVAWLGSWLVYRKMRRDALLIVYDANAIVVEMNDAIEQHKEYYNEAKTLLVSMIEDNIDKIGNDGYKLIDSLNRSSAVLWMNKEARDTTDYINMMKFIDKSLGSKTLKRHRDKHRLSH